MSGGGYPKFKNDRGVPEICIGVKEFMCIGESPPQDHSHIYINMGEADTILCPYCATRFRSVRLTVSLLTTRSQLRFAALAVRTAHFYGGLCQGRRIARLKCIR